MRTGAVIRQLVRSTILGMATLALLSDAAAAAPGQIVNSAQGNAWGVNAVGTVAFLPVNLGPRPFAVTANPLVGSTERASLPGVSTMLLTASTSSVSTTTVLGAGGSSHSVADVGTFALGGLPIGNLVAASGMHAECTATVDGTTLMSSVGSLTIGGMPQVLSGAPNQVLLGFLGATGVTVIVNEQVRFDNSSNHTSAGHANALHIRVNSPLPGSNEDIVLGHAHCQTKNQPA